VVLNEQDGLHVQDKRDGVPMVLEEHNSRHVAAGSDLHVLGESGGTKQRYGTITEETRTIGETCACMLPWVCRRSCCTTTFVCMNLISYKSVQAWALLKGIDSFIAVHFILKY
jgi:hypothetical protein